MTRPSPKPTPEEILARVRQHIADGNYGSACAEFLHLDTALAQHGPLPADWLQDSPYDPPATGTFKLPRPPFPRPETCQHLRISNDNFRCVACNELMIGVTLEAKVIQSAPNINPCRNPEHLAAMREGRQFHCDVPYVPGPVQRVSVGAEPFYQCHRCDASGPDGWQTLQEGEPIVPPCGNSHRGDLIRPGAVLSRPSR